MNVKQDNLPSERFTDDQINAVIRNAIENGARRYIQGCESRVDDFVRWHYSFQGSLGIHAHAVGWDVIRVPINIIWSLVNIILAFVGMLAGLARLKKLRAWINQIPPGLETDMDRQISWLVVTELLQLPHEHGGKRSEHDALMEEIVKDPSLRLLLDKKLDAFVALSKQPDFEKRLKAKLGEYGATRTASADLAGNAVLLVTSKIATGQAAFGTLGAGTAASAALAHSIAASNFWLGSAIGSYYYALVPVAVSLRLLIAVTALIAVVLALISTFIGILTDPLQAKLGIHQRRLRKLIAAVKDDLLGAESNFELREKYIGRLFDLIDVLTTVGRKM
ncbi:DUF6635 family protein [Marinobacter salarius]|uniref:DUF6635 family protein n=1 Tax=Marinobacter salarius TaxID=1420917 RepID=UPI000F85A1AD|nr:DUF6635 family protein [Marinobacter salarius]AZR41255.1 hypothetical protein MTMN5_01805 [Marinobacter salarius]